MKTYIKCMLVASESSTMLNRTISVLIYFLSFYRAFSWTNWVVRSVTSLLQGTFPSYGVALLSIGVGFLYLNPGVVLSHSLTFSTPFFNFEAFHLVLNYVHVKIKQVPWGCWTSRCLLVWNLWQDEYFHAVSENKLCRLPCV